MNPVRDKRNSETQFHAQTHVKQKENRNKIRLTIPVVRRWFVLTRFSTLERLTSMGKRCRSVRVPEDLDSKLVSEADRLGVPIQRLLLDGLKMRLGVKFDVSQVSVPDRPEPGITPLTSGFDDKSTVEGARQVVRSPVRSGIRCTCSSPVGEVRCLSCGKVR